MGIDAAAFHYIQNKENVILGFAKAGTDFRKSHAGAKMSLFKNGPVCPCFAWSVCCFCCQRNCASEGPHSVNPVRLRNVFAELCVFRRSLNCSLNSSRRFTHGGPQSWPLVSAFQVVLLLMLVIILAVVFSVTKSRDGTRECGQRFPGDAIPIL